MSADSDNGDHLDDGGVQVVVRLRPLNEREKKFGTLPVVSASTTDKTVKVLRRQNRSTFAFDNVFTAFSTQEEVFETTMQPVLRDVLMGYESTVFAYGQTGTGKTHTMEGNLDHPDNYGVIPRSAEALFARLNDEEHTYESYRIYCSYLEIYNEELCDLLVEPGMPSAKLQIMEGKQGPFCRGLSQKEVHNGTQLLELMRKAQTSRKVGETNLNKQSSRSHCIFTLSVQAARRLPDGATLETRGKLHMVDLAGSECAKSAGTASDNELIRDRERMNINRSLLTLGRVIKMLKEQHDHEMNGDHHHHHPTRIPYRDSKLTRILQQALGGNSKTVIIATLSPSVTAIDESVSTLNYAQAAHGIVNKPVSATFLTQAPSISRTESNDTTASSTAAAHNYYSLEKWGELETRLEYMTAQVEEAKAALARKHLEQQEFVDRIDAQSGQIKTLEASSAALTAQTVALTAALAESKATCQQTQDELDKTQQELSQTQDELTGTKQELDKTTVLLTATQETEASLTSEATLLLEALKQSIADGDSLHQVVLQNRETDVQRRQVAQEFHASVGQLLAQVKEALDALTQQENAHSEETQQLATTAETQERQFVEQVKQLLREATESVDTAVTAVKASIQQNNGVIPTTQTMVEETVGRINESRAIMQQGEDQLLASLASTRQDLVVFGTTLTELEEQQLTAAETKATADLQSRVEAARKDLTAFGAKLTELESAHAAASETTAATLQKHVASTREDISTFGTKLTELESAHSSSSEQAASTMAQHATKTREHLTSFDERLTKELETAHTTASEQANTTLQQHATSTREDIAKFDQELTALTVAHSAASAATLATLGKHAESTRQDIDKFGTRLTELESAHQTSSQTTMDTLGRQMTSTREHLAAFDTRLTELDSAHTTASEQAAATLQQHATSTREDIATFDQRLMGLDAMHTAKSEAAVSTLGQHAESTRGDIDKFGTKLTELQAAHDESSKQSIATLGQHATSTREHLSNFDTRLTELEGAHAASSEKAMATLQQDAEYIRDDIAKFEQRLNELDAAHTAASVTTLAVLEQAVTTTRKDIASLGTKLAELEQAHATSSEQTLAVLNQHVAAAKERTEQLVSSTCQALNEVKEKRQQIRDTTRETVEQWKLAMIASGDGITEQASTQQGRVDQETERMTTEMQRHVAIDSHLTGQATLLEESHATTTQTHQDQKDLLQNTRETVEASHKQQSLLLSSFVEILMKDVEKLVQAQVAEVVAEVNRGHEQFQEKNAALTENHANITTATLETLDTATSINSSLQEEAAVAKKNDEDVIVHLGETSTMFKDIQTSVVNQTEEVNKFATTASQNLQESQDLEEEDVKVQEQLKSDGTEFTDHLTGPFTQENSAAIEALTDAGTTVCTFTRDDVFETMTADVGRLEKETSASVVALTAAGKTVSTFTKSEVLDTISTDVDDMEKDVSGSLTALTEAGVTVSTFTRDDVLATMTSDVADLEKETTSSIEALTEAGTTVCTFTRDEVLDTMTTDVDSLEKETASSISALSVAGKLISTFTKTEVLETMTSDVAKLEQETASSITALSEAGKAVSTFSRDEVLDTMTSDVAETEKEMTSSVQALTEAGKSVCTFSRDEVLATMTSDVAELEKETTGSVVALTAAGTAVCTFAKAKVLDTMTSDMDELEKETAGSIAQLSEAGKSVCTFTRDEVMDTMKSDVGEMEKETTSSIEALSEAGKSVCTFTRDELLETMTSDVDELDKETTSSILALSEAGKSVSTYAQTEVLPSMTTTVDQVEKETASSISALADAGKSISNFTRTEVLETMKANVDETESPRGELMGNYTQKCSEAEQELQKGFETIQQKANDSCTKADELLTSVNAVALDFENVKAKEHETEIAEMKESFSKSATDHVDATQQQIARCGESSQNASTSADTFVRSDLSAYNQVQEATPRKDIAFSEKLSKTPPLNELLASPNLTNGRNGNNTVLQDVNPNEGTPIRQTKTR